MTAAGVTRAAIVAEAWSWIGTPYRHQASLKGVGCDCLGLIRGVWRALYGPEPEALIAYTPDWAEAQGAETLPRRPGGIWWPSRLRTPGTAMSCSSAGVTTCRPSMLRFSSAAAGWCTLTRGLRLRPRR